MFTVITPPPLSVAQLLGGLAELPVPVASVLITGIADDSRDVGDGYAFVALPDSSGAHTWSHVIDALDAGARLIISEACPDAQTQQRLNNRQAFFVQLNGLSKHLPQLLKRMYPLVPGQMKLVAVTGTNGKSTVVELLRQLLPACATMGTNGICFGDTHQALPLTTNTVVRNHRYLHHLQMAGARYVALEASSIGIDQGRLDGVDIDIAVLTNISRDHLDYHADMDSYTQSKFDLFRHRTLEAAVINVGDPCGQDLARELNNSPMIGFRVYQHDPDQDAPDIYAHQLVFDGDGVRFHLTDRYSATTSQHRSPLLCAHNVENLVAALTVTLCLNLSPRVWQNKIAHLQACPGRIEIYRMRDNRLVVIDYAHTPDALEKLLRGLRRHGFEHISLVFGCGGDRDSGKRAPMGKVAGRYADRVILSNDNPRNEDPDQIIADIVSGMDSDATQAEVIPDRATAIAAALSGQDSNLVVVAGRGNESQQIFADARLDFLDLDAVKKIDQRIPAPLVDTPAQL